MYHSYVMNETQTRWYAAYMDNGRALHRLTREDSIRTKCHKVISIHAVGSDRSAEEIINSVLCRSCWSPRLIDKVAAAASRNR